MCLCLLADLIGPYGHLDLADVGFAQEEHADPGLADAAADGVGQLLIQNGFLERKFCTIRAACSVQLAQQGVFIHTDAHGGQLQGNVQHRIVDKNITV